MSPELLPIQRQADRLRDELVLTLKELDRRRHQVLNFKTRVMQRPRLYQWLAVGAGVGVAVLAGGVLLARRGQKTHIRAARLRGLRRAWDHPERLASARRASAPLGNEVGKRLVVAFVGALVQPLALRAAANWLSRSPRT